MPYLRRDVKVYPMKFRNRLWWALGLVIGVAYASSAQQLSLFTQYRENATLLNPAAVSGDYLSQEQNLTIGATHRVQWTGFENAPRTQTLRANFLYTGGDGVHPSMGGYLVNDQTGPTGFTGLYGQFGAVVSRDPRFGGIAAGLSGGLVQYRVDATQLRTREAGDVLGSTSQSQLFPDVGLGVFAYKLIEGNFLRDDYVYGGVSVPQLIGLNLTFQNEAGEFSTQRIQHAYLTAGLYHFLRDDNFIEPSVWVKYAPNAPVQVDINVRYQLANAFWVGTGGNTAGAAHLEGGVLLGNRYGNQLKIGYGFDYSFAAFGPFLGPTHEINLTYAMER